MLVCPDWLRLTPRGSPGSYRINLISLVPIKGRVNIGFRSFGGVPPCPSGGKKGGFSPRVQIDPSCMMAFPHEVMLGGTATLTIFCRSSSSSCTVNLLKLEFHVI
ncbi:hypothetical protein CEXT_124161 [Caerostris extrusa]|uniref:Uncharacterized protein n=1 Tax=Caerostris extrusa TaxID=172846 RepID=A0AAV4MJC1_CAEEX|nr:hypothetical protein CEXT_124161 [Caerostris extrusa]